MGVFVRCVRWFRGLGRWLRGLFRSSATVEITERNLGIVRQHGKVYPVERSNGAWYYQESDLLGSDWVGPRLSKMLELEHSRRFGDVARATVQR